MTFHRALLALGSLAVVATATLIAAPAATGVITKSGKSLKVVDAFAMETVGNFGDPQIRVRLSDRVLNRTALDAAIDRGFELDDQRAGAGYVDLHLDRKTAEYSASTYELGGSVSCALCGDSAVGNGTKFRIEAGHVRGTMKVAAGSYDKGQGMGFALTLDVPIAVAPTLTPLPNAAASAEAKALQACRASAAKRDDASKAGCFAPDNPAMRSTKTDASLFWTMLTAYDPVWEMTTLTITSGRTRGEWVELSVEGVASGSKSKGLVYLRRTPAGIRYSHSAIE